MPIIDPLPGLTDAYVIGSVHSGYTSEPFMGKLLAQMILGDEPENPLFDPSRLLATSCLHGRGDKREDLMAMGHNLHDMSLEEMDRCGSGRAWRPRSRSAHSRR